VQFAASDFGLSAAENNLCSIDDVCLSLVGQELTCKRVDQTPMAASHLPSSFLSLSSPPLPLSCLIVVMFIDL
jgi:hypothetical protein